MSVSLFGCKSTDIFPNMQKNRQKNQQACRLFSANLFSSVSTRHLYVTCTSQPGNMLHYLHLATWKHVALLAPDNPETCCTTCTWQPGNMLHYLHLATRKHVALLAPDNRETGCMAGKTKDEIQRDFPKSQRYFPESQRYFPESQRVFPVGCRCIFSYALHRQVQVVQHVLAL